MASVQAGLRAVVVGMVANLGLAVVKIVTGVVGHSYALIADGIESTTDIISSLIVLGGLRVAALPPDKAHPYGHGKAESLAGVLAALGLLVAAGLIAWHSIHEILVPHQAPAWFTLPILILVIIIKMFLSHFVQRVGSELASTALHVDAWHHRSDALTSAAVLVGILVARVGGKGYESADDWAALLACLVITWNGVLLLRTAVPDIMDATPPEETQLAIRRLAEKVEGVSAIEKLRVRKSGLGLFMDIHVQVDGNMTVRRSDEIGHRVKDVPIAAPLNIQDVVVHIEPLGHE